VGGIPSVVVDGGCGRLIPPDDVVALAQALADLGRDRSLRDKLGAAARERAGAFSTAVADDAMRAVYARLVRDKGLR
jgi:glycosyltransferase involved in cell wall biosynthesis